MNTLEYAEQKNARGRTPRQEVDYWRAMQIRARIMRDAGELVWRADVAACVSRQWNAIANDLRYSLPADVADRLGGVAASGAVRKAVRESVEALLDSWRKAGGEFGTPPSAEEATPISAHSAPGKRRITRQTTQKRGS